MGADDRPDPILHMLSIKRQQLQDPNYIPPPTPTASDFPSRPSSPTWSRNNSYPSTIATPPRSDASSIVSRAPSLSRDELAYYHNNTHSGSNTNNNNEAPPISPHLQGWEEPAECATHSYSLPTGLASLGLDVPAWMLDEHGSATVDVAFTLRLNDGTGDDEPQQEPGEGEEDCWLWCVKGECKYGRNCYYRHERGKRKQGYRVMNVSWGGRGMNETLGRKTVDWFEDTGDDGEVEGAVERGGEGGGREGWETAGGKKRGGGGGGRGRGRGGDRRGGDRRGGDRGRGRGGGRGRGRGEQAGLHRGTQRRGTTVL